MVNMFGGSICIILGILMLIFQNFFARLWWPSGYGKAHSWRILTEKLSDEKKYDKSYERFGVNKMIIFTRIIAAILIVTGGYLLFF